MRQWLNLFEDKECYDTLICLFKHGPTFDGDIPSKSERDQLFEEGLVDRYDGWNWLTREGVLKCLEIDIDKN